MKPDVGVKAAAIRKLEHELGITGVEIEQFDFVGRIQYKSAFDQVWGEHEIDHILLIKADVEVFLNENEVGEIQWVDEAELETITSTLPVTPWFKLIKDKFLTKWWKGIKANGRYSPSAEDKFIIHRM